MPSVRVVKGDDFSVEELQALSFIMRNTGDLIEEVSAMRTVLSNIAQYDPRWKGQKVNDAPSRGKIIEWAYDCLVATNNISED